MSLFLSIRVIIQEYGLHTLVCLYDRSRCQNYAFCTKNTALGPNKSLVFVWGFSTPKWPLGILSVALSYFWYRTLVNLRAYISLRISDLLSKLYSSLPWCWNITSNSICRITMMYRTITTMKDLGRCTIEAPIPLSRNVRLVLSERVSTSKLLLSV